ncbi:MAG: tRNA-modifying protein YgfZ [Actinomycetota bacterium]|nr:tRNA-modifying protein YgfZ [Actinomycetota bacterium]
MTSPLLARPGAVAAEPPDAGVAAHYGDPYREQRALVAGTATVDLSHRPVVRISGADRLTWLHDLTTQHVLALQPGGWTQALILSPHGHVEHHLQLVDDGTAVWAHVEPGTASDLVGYLDRMRFMNRVGVADVTADWAVLHSGGVDRLVPRGELSSYAGDLAGVAAYEALRVADRRPRLGVDTDHRTIPNEVGWLVRAVHLDKGCYRGQETVARVYNLGRPPRRLALLHLDGSDSELPVTGEPVTYDGREVGRVGTAVRHFELGPLALALVKRQVPDDADVVAGSVPARIDPAPADEPVSPARAAADARTLLPRRR